MSESDADTVLVSLEKVSGIELVSKKTQNTVSETIFNFACVAGAKRGRGGGGGGGKTL